MAHVDAAKIWSLNYRVLLSVISSAEADITALGIESKELFLLAEVDEHPLPAELAGHAKHAQADGDGLHETA